MAVNLNSFNNFAPGLNQPFANIFQAPIVTNRNPKSSDKAPIGTLWVNESASAVYVATSITAAVMTWTNFGGGSGTFSSLTVNPGDITATTGDIIATAGNIEALAGNVTANIDVEALTGEVIWGGDTGTVAAGRMGLTNVTNTTQGTGAMTVLSTTNNTGNNTGYIKMYIGGTTAYIPYWTNIAP